MLQTLSIWLVVVAFAGAGIFNAVGTAATQADFVRWGYPAWWCRFTGAAEVVVAAMIAVPATRMSGLVAGAVIIAAAAVTVLRHRDFKHLAPIGLFVALLVVANQ